MGMAPFKVSTSVARQRGPEKVQVSDRVGGISI